MFTKEVCEQISRAAKTVSGFIGKGATTLIEAFAKGLGAGAATVMS